ncbi:replication initiator protein A [Magnetospirillum molischianum]|nr:replication initiator protein A [Magnetospirillum molischianum]
MTDQVDLFLDSLMNAPIKDERATMEFPFFCLTKKPRTTPMVYNDGKVKIEIKPGSAGIATIWDKDILIYAASIINERIERGMPAERRIVVPAYDILKVCQRGTGKRSYELLLDALERLRATTILTNLTSAEERERRGFGWIDNFRVVERLDKNSKPIMAGVEIWLNEWMFRAVVKERRVLSIDRAYFKLTMGLERRLYELARKHCGYQPRWDIGMARLREKCGAEGPLRNFKVDLKTIIERDSLPGYRMHLMFDATSDMIKGLKADGYDIPPRYGGNDRIVVRFMRKNEAEVLTPQAVDM